MDALKRIGRLFDREARRKERKRRKSGRAYNLDIVEGPLSVFGVWRSSRSVDRW